MGIPTLMFPGSSDIHPLRNGSQLLLWCWYVWDPLQTNILQFFLIVMIRIGSCIDLYGKGGNKLIPLIFVNDWVLLGDWINCTS